MALPSKSFLRGLFSLNLVDIGHVFVYEALKKDSKNALQWFLWQ